LPIQLHEGSIASVSARVPWPNPLVNGVELSVRSLRLVFHLLPRVAKDTHLPSTNLADSISDAAQSFAHEEITHDESTKVHQALKSCGSSSFEMGDNYVPGGLDASSEDPGGQSDVDPTGISMFASMIEYLLSQFTFTAEDINVTVIYPGHSSFKFKVSGIRSGRPTSSPRESTRTIEISGVEIAHCDLSALESSGLLGVNSPSFVQNRPGSTSCRMDPTAATTSLFSSQQTQIDPKEPVKPSEQPDSEHRPRSVSPSESMSSSLFQSALMTQGSERESEARESKVVDSQGIGGNDTVHSPSGRMTGSSRLSRAPGATEGETRHQVILSLATEPIVVYITTSTPQALPKGSTQYQSPSQTAGLDRRNSQQPKLEVSVSVGVIACALTATQICAMLDVISVAGSHSDPIAQPPPSGGSSSVPPALSLLDQMTLTIQIRGFVLLLQSAPTSLTGSPTEEERILPHDALNDFFAHPLVPPKIGHSYFRFVMDTLKADFSVSTTLEHLTGSPFPRHTPDRSRLSRGVSGKTSSRLRFSVGDLSACAFCVPVNSVATPESGETFVLPILLTDLFLSAQYHPEHCPLPVIGRHLDTSPESIRKTFSPLPEFEVLDWTSQVHRTSQAKLSFWRVKPPPGHRRSHRKHGGGSPVSSPMASSPEPTLDEMSAKQSQPAISGQVLLVSPRDPGTDITPGSTSSTSVSIVPIHVFVDMGSSQTALDFLELLSSRRNSPDTGLSSSRSSSSSPERETLGAAYGRNNSGEPTPLSSPHRRTLQPIHLQELDELNLSEDYLSKEPALGRPSPKPRPVPRHNRVGTRLTCRLPTAKLEVKAPSHRDSPAEFDVYLTMVRIQLRCPSPSPHLQRSGAMILDIHGLKLTTGTGGAQDNQFDTTIQPTYHTPGSSDNHMIIAEWRALLLSCCPAGATIAQCFCSIGPLSSAVNDEAPPALDHIRFLDDAPSQRRFAVVKFNRNLPSSQGQNSNRLPTFVIEADIPSMCLNLSKPLFDSLQFWIDDVTRLLETQSGSEAHEGSSRNPSIVGSRFFSNSKQGSVEVSTGESSPKYTESLTESIVKLTISEGENTPSQLRTSYCM
jgi:autophagy-related protein 2